MVFYADECGLDVFWVSSVVVKDFVVLGMCLVELEVGGLSLDVSETFLDSAFGVLLEFVIECGSDGESSHPDVVFL